MIYFIIIALLALYCFCIIFLRLSAEAGSYLETGSDVSLSLGLSGAILPTPPLMLKLGAFKNYLIQTAMYDGMSLVRISSIGQGCC